jgi:hypothetical protein
MTVSAHSSVVSGSPHCVCGHPEHLQFPKGSCHCGCTIFEVDKPPGEKPERDFSHLSERTASQYEWLLSLGEVLPPA